MTEPASDSREQLYQSQWWMRLASFSENRDGAVQLAGIEKENARSNFLRMLVSLLQPGEGSNRLGIFARTN